MTRRIRRRMGPLEQQRLALLLIWVSAALAGWGGYLRAAAGPGESGAGGYLMGTAALLVAAGAAGWQARVAGMLILFNPKAIRRRAILSLLAGICTALVGCVVVSTIETDRYGHFVRALAEAGIAGGFGLGLAGFLSLAWTLGMGYAGARIERLSEEDW
ncbi:hypothetical protein BH23CHL4_BH23CHL4_02910 [soil metagenome]